MANSFQDNNNVPQPARVTGDRDIVSLAVPWRWLMQGKVFEAGFGVEDVDDQENTTSGVAVVATTPQYALQAPAGATPIVIPILLKLMISADGAPGQKIYVAFTKPAGLCATTLALSGTTALTSKHCLYQSNPKQTEQTATAVFGDPITVSALVAADYIAYHYGVILDAVLTSGLVAMGEGPSNVQNLRFLRDGLPHLMTSGAAMLVYLVTQTTDAVIGAYMQWAEVTEDDLL